MKTVLRLLSSFLVLFAFVALARLLFSDLRAGFLPSADQQRAGSWALIIVGASYVCVQLANGAGIKERVKGVFLGLAFVLWGGEHFVPAGAPVVTVDFLVIAIFVVDLALMIRSQLAAGPAKTKRP